MTARPADGDRLSSSSIIFHLADALDEHRQGAADQCLILLVRDRLLQLHDRVAPLLGDFRRHRIGQRGALGARLVGIGKDADVVELHLGDEIVEPLECRFGFAGMADDQRRPHHRFGQCRAGVVDQPPGHVDAAGPSHQSQNLAVGVLYWHVEVGHDHLVLGHLVDQPQRQQARIDVEQA